MRKFRVPGVRRNGKKMFTLEKSTMKKINKINSVWQASIKMKP